MLNMAGWKINLGDTLKYTFVTVCGGFRWIYPPSQDASDKERFRSGFPIRILVVTVRYTFLKIK